VGAGVAATVPKRNTAEAAAVVGGFLLPLPFPLLVCEELVVVARTDAALTSCVPVVEAGTLNVALNEPFPPTVMDGMPAAEPSHVSCTVAWPKFEPETVTTVPASPDAGERLSAGLGAAA
jgi:hypothetical protein